MTYDKEIRILLWLGYCCALLFSMFEAYFVSSNIVVWLHLPALLIQTTYLNYFIREMKEYYNDRTGSSSTGK